MSRLRVFISYRRLDDQPRTDRLCDHLRQLLGDESVLRDYDTFNVGPKLRDEITSVITRCNVVVAVIGAQWSSEQNTQRLQLEGDPVRFELETARRLGRPIVPVLVGNAQVPNLPGLEFVADALACVVRDDPDFKRDVEKVASACWSARDTSRRPAPMHDLPALPVGLIRHLKRLVWSADVVRGALVRLAEGKATAQELLEANESELAAADTVISRWLEVFPSETEEPNEQSWDSSDAPAPEANATAQKLHGIEKTIEQHLRAYDAIANDANSRSERGNDDGASVAVALAHHLFAAINEYTVNAELFAAASRARLERAIRAIDLMPEWKKSFGALALAQKIAEEARFSRSELLD